LFKKAFDHRGHVWFKTTDRGMALTKKDFYSKTGSMIGVGELRETVINIVGLTTINKKTYLFSCLNYFRFDHLVSQAVVDEARNELINNLIDKLYELSQP
jgi:hypothetical protein